MKKIGALVIVFSVLFTITIAPIFAETIPDYSPSIFASTYLDTTNNEAYTTYRVSSLQPYVASARVDVLSYAPTSSSNTGTIHLHTYNIKQDYVVSITIQNTSGTGDILIPTAYIHGTIQKPANTPLLNSDDRHNYLTKGWEISQVSGDFVSVGTSGGDDADDSFDILLDSQYYSGGYIVLPNGYKIHGQFVLTRTYNVEIYTNNAGFIFYSQNSINTYFDSPASSLTFTNYNITATDRESHLIVSGIDNIEQYTKNIHDHLVSVLSNQQTIINNQNLAYIQRSSTNNLLTSIDSNVQTITDAYTSNASNVTDTQSNISATNTAEQQLHQAEQSFYQQNEQALNNVGLSNFSFSSDQSSGLGSVITDFTTLWNNIGPLQIIFTFTLSMSLATFLLRHKPVTGAIKKNESRK